jgi:hypothetical protein
MIRQQRLDRIEQAWPSEQIKKGVRISVLDLAAETSPLPRGWVLVRMHHGWLPGWSMNISVFTVSPTPAFP